MCRTATFSATVPSMNVGVGSSQPKARCTHLRWIVRHNAPRLRHCSPCAKFNSEIASEIECSPLMPPQEVERRIRKLHGIVSMAEQLAPFDPASFSPALLICIEGPCHECPSTLQGQVSGINFNRCAAIRSIVKLWRLAEGRYVESIAQQLSSENPSYSILKDFCPDQDDEVYVYKGRAAVPLRGVVGRFAKVFFKPRDSPIVYGRVDVMLRPVSDRIYSNFFACSLERTIVPATTELAEVSLDYESPLLRDLRSEDLPSSRRWPAVRGTRWPFTGLVDYLRPVGPGVYVGCGWKSSSDPGNYRRFLHFLLVRDYS